MEKVIETLYGISSELHSFLNESGSFGNGHFWSKGKIFHDEKDAYNHFAPNPKPVTCKSYDEDGNLPGRWCKPSAIEHESEMIDCRFDSVDSEMKQFIYDRLCMYIIDFRNKSDSEDEFLLVLGFAINLYYIVGLYSTYGKFDVNKVLKSTDSVEVKEYGRLINEFLYSKITEGIVENVKEMEFVDVALNNESMNKILKNLETAGLENMYKSVKKCDKNYIPDLYMMVKENDFERTSIDYLNDMVTRYPDFRFGWVYCCIQKGLEFYETMGEDIGVIELKDKLGNDLFLHTLGIKVLHGEKFEIVNEKIETVRGAIFSEFELGIPKIETVNRSDFFNNLVNELLENADQRKTVSFTNIRENTERILGVNVIALIDDSPLNYMVRIFDVVEQQRKELKLINKELFKLNEQRRNLIDHLAHSWGNECYPEIVKNVADELLRNGKKSLANRLFKAYNSENNLMGEIIFLQSAMEDEPGKLKEVFSDSFYISGKGKKEWKIHTVIEEALENLVFSLLNYSGDKEKRIICQKKLCIMHSLEELAEDYSKRFEVDKELISESFIQWFSKNIFPVVIKVDECWEKINFGKTEYGKIVVKNIFTELFTNVLFHGEGMCEVVLDSADDKLYVKVRNSIAKEIAGRQKGLNSLKEVITKLNYNTSVSEDDGLYYEIKKGNIFETVVVFAKDLMFIDEEW